MSIGWIFSAGQFKFTFSRFNQTAAISQYETKNPLRFISEGGFVSSHGNGVSLEFAADFQAELLWLDGKRACCCQTIG